MKFLVIQQKMIGDVLTSTVICQNLRQYFPASDIHFVANQNTLPVLQNNPFVDEVIIFKSEYRKSKWAFYNFLKSIRQARYDTVIDVYGKLESNLISLFSKSKVKITHDKWYTRWIYTHTIKENLIPSGATTLAIQNRLALLAPIVKQANEFLAHPRIFLEEAEIEEARIGLTKIKEFKDQQVLMIGILGSSPLKTYPAANMAEVLDYICKQSDAKLLFNYIPSQEKEARAIYDLCNAQTKSKIAFDYYAPSLRKFIALLSQCTALVGNEGGAVNMAKAMNVDSFCIFSPFILKGAWHSDKTINQVGVHLADYRPELLEGLDKNGIKKNIDDLYKAFEPQYFKAQLGIFLKQLS